MGIFQKIGQYLTTGLAVLAAILFALLKGAQAARAREQAAKAEADKRQQGRLARAYAEGEAEFNRRVDHAKTSRARRGRFTRQ